MNDADAEHQPGEDLTESWLSLICSGVWPSSACESASAILPISVSMPVRA